MIQKQFINAINRHGVNKVEILDYHGAELKYTLNNGKNIYSQTQGDRDGGLEFYYESELERTKRLKPTKKSKKNAAKFFSDLQSLTPLYLHQMTKKYTNVNYGLVIETLSNDLDIAQSNTFSHLEK